jgi:mRNA deadenylase 3'-5' endonuclease subunit Ccr4
MDPARAHAVAGHFVGVLDYIFLTKNHLQTTQLLQIDDEENLKTSTALPNPQYASDHCSLVATVDWVATDE